MCLHISVNFRIYNLLDALMLVVCHWDGVSGL